MVKHLCLLVHDNLYDSKRHFAHGLAKALRKLGVEVTILDLGSGSLEAYHVQEILHAGVDLTASFNSINPIKGSSYLWDLLKIPHLSLLVDPALYSFALTKSPYSILSCVDRQDVQLLHQAGFERAFFLPHATESELCDTPQNDKPYDVVFIGSSHYSDAWKAAIPSDGWPAVESAIQMVLHEPNTTIQEALLRLWNTSQLDPAKHNFLQLFSAIDMGSRSLDRLMLIRNLRDVTVHVFGEGDWKQHLKGSANVVVHGAVSYAESIDITKKAKISLNSMPFFKHGSHERLFTGLAAGCLVLNSPSNYVYEQFSEGNGVITYQFGDWDEVNKRVQEYLKDETRRHFEVDKGRLLVKQHHTWDARAKELLEAMNKLQISEKRSVRRVAE